MLIPKPIVVTSALALGLFALMLVLVVPDAWNDYQHSFSTEFRNATGDRLCAKHAEGCSAEITPHGASYWDMDGSCPPGVMVPAKIFTPDGELIYSRVAECGDWNDASILINMYNGEYVVVDDLPAGSTE